MAVDERKARASGPAGGKDKEPKRDNFWLYIWLGISGLLNISGMASIVEGFVTWAKFFREFIDAYRWAIRDPLAHLGNAIWPLGHIPGWVFDVFVLYSGLFLALNIFAYRERREPIFNFFHDVYHKNGLGSATYHVLFFTFFLPVTLLLGYLLEAEHRNTIRDILKNFAFILGLFILILLVNWQLKKLA
jgi:hypothetical protein